VFECPQASVRWSYPRLRPRSWAISPLIILRNQYAQTNMRSAATSHSTRRLPAMTARHRFALSPRIARESCIYPLPLNNRGRGECRVPGAPAASCAHGGSKNAHEYSQRGRRNSPTFPTQWFTAYSVLSPAIGFVATVACESCLCANLTPASRRQDHTSSPSASVPFVIGASTSTASRPASVTIASRPSCGTGRHKYLK
jgi:hypothetical protein